MLDLILKLFIILGSFFYIILTIFMYLFAVYVLVNRKTLRLGYSLMEPTILDFIIICSIPVFLTFFPYVIYYDFNTN